MEREKSPSDEEDVEEQVSGTEETLSVQGLVHLVVEQSWVSGISVRTHSEEKHTGQERIAPLIYDLPRRLGLNWGWFCETRVTHVLSTQIGRSWARWANARALELHTLLPLEVCSCCWRSASCWGSNNDNNIISCKTMRGCIIHWEEAMRVRYVAINVSGEE